MFLGIDSGSTSTKLVLVNEAGRVLSRRVAPTGLSGAETAERLWREMAGELAIDASRRVPAVATGYARRQIARAGRVVTEITCHAAGVNHLLPQVRNIIDIGGQDSKAIRLGAGGQPEDFAMNDKCAAGTGRFLEVIAGRFGLAVEELGAAFDVEAEPVEINSTCTVFAETEVIGLLSHGASRDAILAGVHLALARRVAALADHVGFADRVAFSGGVALNVAMVRYLERCLKLPVIVAPEPQLTAALGAALLAREAWRDGPRT